MTDIVLDASAVAAWYLPTQASRSADALLAAFAQHRFLAPQCFAYEVPNLMLKHERRGTLASGTTEKVERDLREVIRVQVGKPPERAVLLVAVAVARDYGISVFDALYVLLSKHRGAPLVSRDERQLVAAVKEGCSVIDLLESP